MSIPLPPSELLPKAAFSRPSVGQTHVDGGLAAAPDGAERPEAGGFEVPVVVRLAADVLVFFFPVPVDEATRDDPDDGRHPGGGFRRIVCPG